MLELFEQHINGVTVKRPNSENELGLNHTDTNGIANTNLFNTAAVSQSGRHIYDNQAIADELFGKGKVNVANSTELKIPDIQKKLAEEQGVIEQFFNGFIMQGLIGEVAIGTLKGFVEISDVVRTMFRDEHMGEFASDLTKVMESWQNDLRKNFAIHRENPDRAFDFANPWEYLMSNVPNMLTTVSLLVPAAGLTKGVSMLGKGTLALARKSGKIANVVGKEGHAIYNTLNHINNTSKSFKIADTGLLAKQLETFGHVGTQAVFSRTIENFQEAREVFNSNFEYITKELDGMSKEDFDDFIENNPQYKGMDKVNIAKDIAGTASSETFKKDYAMLIFDFMQYKSLSKALSGRLDDVVDASVRNLNRQAAGNITSTVAKKNIFNQVKDATVYYATHPIEFLKTVQVTEGIEEMYQGWAAESSGEPIKAMFDPNYSYKTLGSYLRDPHLWDQGFWGMMGGTAFSQVIKAYNKYELNKKIRKDPNLTQEQIADLKRSRSEVQIAEINSRVEKYNNFIDNLHKINQGFNPFEIETDVEGKPIIENGNPVNVRIDESDTDTQNSLREKAVNQYIADLYLNAAFNGTAALLDDYIDLADFDKAIAESGALTKEEAKFNNYIKDNYKRIKNVYESVIRDIYSNIPVENHYVAKAMAADVVAKTLQVQGLDIDMDVLQKLLNETYTHYSDDELDNINAFANQRFIIEGKKRINELEAEISKVEALHQGDKIGKTARDARITELKEYKNAILRSIAEKENNGLFSEDIKQELRNLSKGVSTLKNVDEFIKTLDDILTQYAADYTLKGDNISISDENIKRLILKKNDIELNKSVIESQIPNTGEKYKETFDDFSNSFDKMFINRFNKAIKDIENYIRNSENVDEAFKNIVNEENLPEELKEAAKIIKYGNSLTGNNADERFMRNNLKDLSILGVVADEKRKRDKNAIPSSENTDLTQEDKDKANEAFDEVERTIKDNSSSTGEQQRQEKGKKKNNVKEEATEEELKDLGNKDELDIILEPDKETKDDDNYAGVGIPKQEQRDDSSYAELSRNEVIYETAKHLANKIILDIINKYIQANNLSDISQLGINSAKYQEMYNEIVTALNEDARIIDTFKKEFIIKAKIRNIFKTNKKAKNTNIYDKVIEDLNNELKELSKANADSLIYSLTDTLLTEKEIIETFNDYIKNYLLNNEFIKEVINGKEVLDINMLIQNLIENNILSRNQLIDFIKKINQYKNNDLFKYSIYDSTYLDKYKNNYGDLINEFEILIKERKEFEKRQQDGTVEVSMRVDGSNGRFNGKRTNIASYRNLVNRLLEDTNNKLVIEYDYYTTKEGIRIIKGIKYKIVDKNGMYWRISNVYENAQGEIVYEAETSKDESIDDVEVGYVTVVQKNKTNDSIKIQPLSFRNIVLNNSGFMWNIDKNGCLDDNINNLFLTLINNCNSSEDNIYKQLFNIFRSVEKLDITNDGDLEIAKKILGNDLVKALKIGHYSSDNNHGSFGVNGEGIHYLGDEIQSYYVDSKTGEIRYYKGVQNEKALIDMANILKQHINSILFHDVATNTYQGNISEAGLAASYKKFLYKVYQNYIQTANIQSQLDDVSELQKTNKDATNVDNRLITNFAGFEKMEFNIVEEAVAAAELEEMFGYNVHNHPIVIVSENPNHLVIDGKVEEIESDLSEDSNSSMGVILGYQEADVTKPIIYWIPNQNMNHLYNKNDGKGFNASRKALCDAVRKEVKRLIKEYIDSDKNSISFDTLNESLSQLLGGSIGSRSNILSGVKLLSRKDKKAILFSFGNKKIEDLDGKDIADLAILIDDRKNVKYTERNEKGKLTKAVNITDETIDSIVDTIIQNLTFNKSYAVLRPKSNVTNNYFKTVVKKENTEISNKLVIDIGDYHKEYDSYTEFLYDIDGFKMNIEVDPQTGSPFNTKSNNNRTDAILIDYMNITYKTTSPVERRGEMFDRDNFIRLLDESKGNPIETRNILLAVGFTEAQADFYLGDNEEGIAILPEQIYYDPKDKSSAHTVFGQRTKRISITKTGRDYILDGGNYTSESDKNANRRITIRRNLLHENIHSIFDTTNQMKVKKNVDDIINTYIATIEAINNVTVEKGSILEDIKNYINEFFNPIIDEATGKIDIEKTIEQYHKKAYGDRKYNATSARKLFAEEWITECLTQSSLMEYLTTVDYTENGEVVQFEQENDSENNSIFKKIINILLEIFGINLDNSKNNSIFARQYQILTRESNTTERRKVKPLTPNNNNQLIINFGEETGGSANVTLEGTNNEIETIDTQDNILDNFLEEEEFMGMFSKTRNILTKEEIVLNSANNTNINTNGILSANNMQNFLEMFPEKEKLIIAENIKNGNIKYVCK